MCIVCLLYALFPVTLYVDLACCDMSTKQNTAMDHTITGGHTTTNVLEIVLGLLEHNLSTTVMSGSMRNIIHSSRGVVRTDF